MFTCIPYPYTSGKKLQLQLLPGMNVPGHPTMHAAAAKMAPLEAFSCGFYQQLYIMI